MSVEKRKRWRAQEQELVARWNAAVARHAQVSAEIASAGPQPLNGALALRMQTAQAELEAVRREVARIKVAFNSGTRY
jgi:hypothetical protein